VPVTINEYTKRGALGRGGSAGDAILGERADRRLNPSCGENCLATMETAGRPFIQSCEFKGENT